MRTVDELKQEYLNAVKEVLVNSNVKEVTNAIMNKEKMDEGTAAFDKLHKQCAAILKKRMTSEEFLYLSAHFIEVLPDMTKLVSNYLTGHVTK